MNDLLKKSTNPSYSTVEKAIPEYFEALDYYKKLVGIHDRLTEKELLNLDIDISKHKYKESELFAIIKKAGFMSYQVINHSYSHCTSDGMSGLNIDVERIFIEHIVDLSKHLKEIADYYYADEEIVSSLNATIEEGTRFVSILTEALSLD